MKKLTVSEWQDEIQAGLDYRELYAFENAWDTLEMDYLNDPKGSTALGPNLVFSEGDTLLSALIVPNPEYSITPLDVGSVESAPLVQSIANMFIKPEQMDIKASVEDGMLHCYLNSKVILKLGYDSEFGWNPKWDVGSLKNPWGMSYTRFNKKGQLIEFNSVKPGMPWVMAVAPADFVVPWGTGRDVESAPWIAFRVIRETQYFKDDPKYKNTSSLKPQMSMEDFMNSYHHGRQKYRIRYNRRDRGEGYYNAIYTEGWEIHDKRTGRIYMISFDHDKFFRDDPNFLMAAIGGYPVVTAGFTNHPRAFWSTPLAYYLGSHQQETFDLSLQANKQRRLNVLKFLMVADAMTPEERAKIISGDVGAIAEATLKSGKKLQDIFMAFPKGTNIDLMAESELIRRNAREVIGQSRNQAGEFDASSRRTAREAVIVDTGAGRRMTKKTDVAVYCYREVIRKSMLMVFSYWKQPRSILVGDKWRRFVGDRLKGRYAYNADLVNRAIMSPAQRKMESLQMMVYLSQFPNVNLAAVQQYVIAAADDPSFEGFFTGIQPQGAMQGRPQPGGGGGEGRPTLGAGVSNNGEGL